MKKFFSRLNYSFGNEDWNTELKALRIQPNDKVVCVTASGDRPLHLLLNECRELHAVDLNPIQNHLLQIKMAAMKNLDFDSYLGFLGGIPFTNRLTTLHLLKDNLPRPTAEFWIDNYRMVDNGLLYEGYTERAMQKLVKYVWVFWRRKINKLFSFDNLEEQREFVKKEWDCYSLRKFFEMALRSTVVTRMWLKDPGLYDLIGNSISPGQYLFDRMIASLNKKLANENLFLSYVFQGTVGERALPPYLTRRGTAVIKPRLNKITIHTANIIDFLEQQPESSVDCFSLSDVASYITQDEFNRLVDAIYRCGKPGARFCIREFLSAQQIPEHRQDHFERDPALEAELEAEDFAFVYRFCVGTLKKPCLKKPARNDTHQVAHEPVLEKAVLEH